MHLYWYHTEYQYFQQELSKQVEYHSLYHTVKPV